MKRLAADKIGLCNEALGLIGDSQITDVEEHSNEARACKRVFDRIRDELLGETEWSFAHKIESLAFVGYGPGGLLRYERPKDCLYMLRIYGPEGLSKNLMEYRPVGQEVWCMVEQAYGEYTSRNFSFKDASAHWLSAFVYRLAAEICTDLTEDNGKKAQLFQGYGAFLAKAKLFNGQERVEFIPEYDTYGDARN